MDDQLLRVDMDKHDIIGLIEPDEVREYAVGDEIVFRYERWKVQQIATPSDDSFAARLVCSRVTS